MNISCIGALNWDRKLRLAQALQTGTSNPVQQLTCTAGGVAFNLARQLARLGGARVRQVSAWGDDPEGLALQRDAQLANVELLGLPRPHTASGQYTAVLQADGELALALADMQVLDDLPEPFWQLAETVVRQSNALALDMNLTNAGLQRLIHTARAQAVPVALVAVSAPKMRHLPDDLRGVGLLLLNRDELTAFAHHADLPHKDLHTSWHALQQRGLEALLVTQGADGATLCTPGSVKHHAPPERLEALDVTGAGDALSASTLHALWVQGLPLPESLACGQQAAAAVLLSLESA